MSNYINSEELIKEIKKTCPYEDSISKESLYGIINRLSVGKLPVIEDIKAEKRRNVMSDEELRKHLSIIDDYCEDIKNNPIIYFCQVYEDVDQTKEIDFFTIRKNDLPNNNYDEAEKFAIDYVRQLYFLT